MSKNLQIINNDDLVAFVDGVELLRQCHYLQSSENNKVSLNYKKGIGMTYKANISAREDIEVILMRIRPLIEYNERLYVGRIITYLLDKYGQSDFLKSWQTLLLEGGQKSQPSISFNGKEYFMRDFFFLYMYGKYFHKDKDKEGVIRSFEKVLGPLTEYFALGQLDRYIGIVFSVGGYIIRKGYVKNVVKS